MAEREKVLDIIDAAKVAGACFAQSCALLGLEVRTVRRWRSDRLGDRRKLASTAPVNKLSDPVREAIKQTANSPEYRDLSPCQIVPRLADKGEYLASVSSFYRILHDEKQLNHRQACTPKSLHPPEPVTATGPNQVYTWDITYLATCVRGMYYYLYMVIDIFSRKIVGWQVHECEYGEYAAGLIKDICIREGILPEQVTLHSDNGAPMTCLTMLAMLHVLGIKPSFSRPGVSDDNPYSESLFRTVKYMPRYPGHFTDLKNARAYFEKFVHWYNEEHLHSGIKFVTPGQRHRGCDVAILENRKTVFEHAKQRHPERWNGRPTRNWNRITQVHLNPGKEKTKSEQKNPAMAEAA